MKLILEELGMALLVMAAGSILFTFLGTVLHMVTSF